MDYSAKVIKEMKKMAIKKGKKDMRFQKMDLRDLGEFENERFGTILDKACLDAVRYLSIKPTDETTSKKHYM